MRDAGEGDIKHFVGEDRIAQMEADKGQHLALSLVQSVRDGEEEGERENQG